MLMKRIYYVPIGLAVLAIFIASLFFIPPTPQSITAPSEVYCKTGSVRVKFIDSDIRSGDIDEMLFQHGSSTIRDCPLWAALRDGQSIPVIQSATFEAHDISDYIIPVQKMDGYGISWLSGFTVTNSQALVSFLEQTYGILDSEYDRHDLVVNIIFFEGSCNQDLDCGDDEYCMLAENKCYLISCDDGDVCTTDSAVNHECVYEDIPGCCHDNSECASDEVCTSNVCTKGCREVPERPCDLAVWTDVPECSWSTAPCDEAFQSIIYLVLAIAGLGMVIIFIVWRLRK
jgi:hypothetical protein